MISSIAAAMPRSDHDSDSSDTRDSLKSWGVWIRFTAFTETVMTSNKRVLGIPIRDTLQAIVFIAVLLLPILAAAQKPLSDPLAQMWRDQLNEKDPGKIQEAVYEVAKHSDDFVSDLQVIRRLTDLLTERHELADVREVAVYALDSIGLTAYSAVPQLVESLKDNKPDIQSGVVEALGK